MRVGIIQPNYVPWRGYFDFVDDVDTFVFYDDVEHGLGKKWRNRNVIKTPAGRQWLTVPRRHGRSGALVHEVAVDYSTRWIDRHVNLLNANYRRTPYWEMYQEGFERLLRRRYEFVADLDIDVCLWIMAALGIDTTTSRARDLVVGPCDKSIRPLRFLERLGATAYLTGPSSLRYTDVQAYKASDIRLEIKSYGYPAYPQLWGPFDGGVSVLDLLFNVGPYARQYLKSDRPNRVLSHGVCAGTP